MTDRALPPIPSRRRLRRGDETGAALVEFALVFLLFMFILYALITFGLILAQKQNITNAAADGARAAVGQSTDAGAVSAATARVTTALGAPGTSYTLSAVPGACSGGSGRCITVTVRYDYQNHPLVPVAPGLGLAVPNTFQSTAVVQFS